MKEQETLPHKEGTAAPTAAPEKKEPKDSSIQSQAEVQDPKLAAQALKDQQVKPEAKDKKAEDEDKGSGGMPWMRRSDR
jgi:hypothetical protein